MLNKMFASRKAIALPLVLVIVIMSMVLAGSIIIFRKESKQQNIVNMHFLRVNFLAQSAVQLALLKIKAFPQEAYDVGVLSLGYCPFRGIIAGSSPVKGNPNRNALKLFFEDCNSSDGYWKWHIPELKDNNDNNFKIETDSIVIKSAYNNVDDKSSVLTTEITGIGESKLERGNFGIRSEKIKKTIQLTGSSNN